MSFSSSLALRGMNLSSVTYQGPCDVYMAAKTKLAGYGLYIDDLVKSADVAEGVNFFIVWTDYDVKFDSTSFCMLIDYISQYLTDHGVFARHADLAFGHSKLAQLDTEVLLEGQDTPAAWLSAMQACYQYVQYMAVLARAAWPKRDMLAVTVSEVLTILQAAKQCYAEEWMEFRAARPLYDGPASGREPPRNWSVSSSLLI